MDERSVAKQKQPVPDRAEGTINPQVKGRSSPFLGM